MERKGSQERKPQLHITATPEQVEQIKLAAFSEGLSVASFVRQAVLSRLKQAVAAETEV